MAQTVEGKTERELLQETFKLARDNNRMLRAIRRDAFISGVFKLVFWIVLVGFPIYAFYTYVLPYLNQLQAQAEAVQSAIPVLPAFSFPIPDFLKSWFDILSGNQ